MNFPDRTFDLIFARGVLNHLNLQEAVPKLSRVLSNYGKVVFAEPICGNPLITIFRYLTPHLRTPDEKPLNKNDIKYVMSFIKNANIKYYGCLTILSAILFKNKYPLFEKIDDMLLNKFKLGPYLAWACIIFTGQDIKT